MWPVEGTEYDYDLLYFKDGSIVKHKFIKKEE
jgi:hypothetical protein